MAQSPRATSSSPYLLIEIWVRVDSRSSKVLEGMIAIVDQNLYQITNSGMAARIEIVESDLWSC